MLTCHFSPHYLT